MPHSFSSTNLIGNFLLSLVILCVSVLPSYMSAHHCVPGIHGVRRGTQSPWIWSYRWFLSLRVDDGNQAQALW